MEWGVRCERVWGVSGCAPINEGPNIGATAQMVYNSVCLRYRIFGKDRASSLCLLGCQALKLNWPTIILVEVHIA